ncbi:hypothetical protein [Bacillus cereus]|nr:hypothetical protein [Bacillus cereus]
MTFCERFGGDVSRQTEWQEMLVKSYALLGVLCPTLVNNQN